MGKIARYLNQLTIGNVFDNPEILEKYAVDHSALKVKPKFVAFPESTDDIRKLLKFFDQLTKKGIKVAVAARGSGYDTGGAAITNGIIISTERMNRLLEIDPREKLVHVQAGITLRELNTALSVSGLTIPVSGHNHETIGGLIANAPVDDFQGKHGGIMNFVERIEVVLVNGECLQTDRLKKYAVAKKASEKTFEGKIFQKMAKITYEKKGLIEKIGNREHDLAGYPFVAQVSRKETMDLMPLFFGSQGTLGIISEVILRAVPMKNKPVRAVITCKELPMAIKLMREIKKLKPEKINFYDLKIIEEARESGKNLDGVIKRLDDGYAVFATFAEWGNMKLKKIAAMKNNYPRGVKFLLESTGTRQTLDEFENSLVNYLAYVENSERVPILTDFYIPEYNLEKFTDDLEILAKKLELDLALYGSYASENYSLRPKFNLEDENYSKKVTTFLRAGAYIIERNGGQISGGTPEGRIKAVVVNEKMPEDEKELYAEIKKVFDPNDVLNPDIKLGASSRFTLTHFRKENRPRI